MDGKVTSRGYSIHTRTDPVLFSSDALQIPTADGYSQTVLLRTVVPCRRALLTEASRVATLGGLEMTEPFDKSGTVVKIVMQDHRHY